MDERGRTLHLNELFYNHSRTLSDRNVAFLDSPSVTRSITTFDHLEPTTNRRPSLGRPDAVGAQTEANIVVVAHAHGRQSIS